MSGFESRPGLLAQEEFTWRDGERTIVFRDEALADVVEALRWQEWDRYELLTTHAGAERRAAAASRPRGRRARGAARRRERDLGGAAASEVDSPALVALGGGRVIDTAKAIAAVRGGRVAALPTTLSGAEMTAIHKLPDGH